MGRNGRIRRAPGFEDRAGRDFERLDSAIRTARDVLYSRGYQPIETPLIEQTELFLRRSGGLLSSQLFDFLAPDGSNITLRPELTAPVIRHALERGGTMHPMRYQYASPIFRYTERPFDAPPNSVPSKRQYIQAGAELIGATQTAADGEIIATAYEMAKRLGVENVSIRLGHVGLIWEMLGRFNLSERAALFLANHVSDFSTSDDDGAAIEAEAIRLGLMPTNGGQSVETQASAAHLLTRLATGSVQLPSPTEQTSRTAEEVVAGLRRKVESDVANADFRKAMELMRRTARTTSDAITNAASIAEEYGLGELDNIGAIQSVVDAAERAGVGNVDISVDFGLATSVAYYSGMIFEVYVEVEGEHVSLGGGGRYDGLATALGSDEDVPALGFALNLDTILELNGGSAASETRRKVVVLAPADEDAQESIVDAAAELRGQGYDVFALFDATVDAGEAAASIGDVKVVLVSVSGSLTWVAE